MRGEGRGGGGGERREGRGGRGEKGGEGRGAVGWGGAVRIRVDGRAAEGGEDPAQ